MADVSKLFEIVISAVDKFSAPLEKINEHINHLGAPVRELNEHFAKLGEAAGLEKIGEKFEHLGETIKEARHELVEYLGPLAALGAAGSIAGLAEMALKVSETGERIHDAAIKIGIDAESLQKLDFAAKLNSVDPEALETGLTKLNRVLGDSAAGKNKVAAAMFGRLGIDIRDAQGHVRSAADVMPDLAEALQKNDNAATRTRIAVTAFSRAGAQLLPMLVQGREALAKWAKEAEAAGILTIEQVNEAKEFADKYTIFKATIEGVSNAIGAKLLPVLLPLIDRLTEWLKTNREIIATKVEHFVERLAEALENIDFDKVVEDAAGFFSFMGRMVDLIGGVKNAVGLLVLVLAGPLIATIYGLVTAFGGLAIAIQATPIGWIADGVTLLALAGYELYEHWSEVKTFFAGLGEVLSKPFEDAWHWLGRMNDAANDFQGRLVAFAHDPLPGLIDAMRAAWSAVTGIFDAAWSKISPIIDRLGNISIGGVLGDVLRGIGGFLTAPIGRGEDQANAQRLIGGAGRGEDQANGQRLIDATGRDSTFNAKITFEGVPKGVRVETKSSGPDAPDVNVGYYGMGWAH